MWPWSATFLGPPGNPQNFTKVTDGMLITNYLQEPSDSFYANFAENLRLADERWIQWFGSLRAGPFNTQCMADTQADKNCFTDPQQLPEAPA